MHVSGREHYLQLGAHLLHEGYVHQYPLTHVVQTATSGHNTQFYGVQGAHDFVLSSYEKPALQVLHSVAFSQLAQLAMQGRQFLLASGQNPEAHSLQTVLFS